MTVHGDVFVNGTITENTCDKRIKNNINDVDNSKALEIIKKIPSKKCGDISNIANAINFCIKSDYVSGSVISIDGAMY